MKNFTKRFRHAAKHTHIRCSKPNLKKRYFIGKHLFIDITIKMYEFKKSYYVLPFSIMVPHFKKRHYHRMNMYILQNSVNHA